MNAGDKLPVPATFEDLASRPDDARLEVVAGEVVEKEMATYEHGDCQGLIISETNRRFRRGGDGRPGWWFASEVFIWFVNLEHQTLTALRLGPEGYVMAHVTGPDREARVPPFDHEPIDVAQFFGLEPEDSPVGGEG